MNEFDKWWGNTNFYINIEDRIKCSSDLESIAKSAWNAALSKVLLEASKIVNSNDPIDIGTIRLFSKINSMVVI